jgi:hypothetical protein
MIYPLDILHNGAQLRLVGVHPTAKTAFYVNDGKGGIIGVRVYPDGRQVVVNPSYTKLAFGKKRDKTEGYLLFRGAWGHNLHILASHAVYIAWRNKEIPAGMTIDHINGVTTNNDFRNLRCVSNAINNRDGGFLRKLRNKGINPPDIRRPYLLRYFDRMAFIKENIPRLRYYHLDRADLMTILFYDLPVVYAHFEKQYHLSLPLKLGLL